MSTVYRPKLDHLLNDRPEELTGEVTPSGPEPTHQQHLMLAALGLLFAALLVVTARNWDFWSEYLFPQSAVSEMVAEGTATKTTSTANAKPGLPLSNHRSHASAKAAPAASAPEGAVVTTQRTVLPPLEIEVVSGDQHSKLQPKTNTLHVELDSSSQAPAAAQTSGAVTQAAQRAPITSSSDVVSHEVDPSYPYLAKQMKVQGSVLLRALISRTGEIQDLEVLKGPAVLAEAAREAVKQWRFKPYLQGGQPVETEAQVKVNFTISTY
jgi:TonB family protein